MRRPAGPAHLGRRNLSLLLLSVGQLSMTARCPQPLASCRLCAPPSCLQQASSACPATQSTKANGAAEAEPIDLCMHAGHGWRRRRRGVA